MAKLFEGQTKSTSNTRIGTRTEENMAAHQNPSKRWSTLQSFALSFRRQKLWSPLLVDIAISDLLSCIDELNQSPNQSPEAKDQNDSDLLLRIHGIDASPTDFCEKLCHIVSSKLHIPCTSDLFSISEMHTPSENSATRAASQIFTSQVTVKIASPTLRNNIYRARTLLKGTSIFLSEVLSKSNQYLFYLSRKMRRSDKIAATWTFKGQVYIRSLDDSIKMITSPSELAVF